MVALQANIGIEDAKEHVRHAITRLGMSVETAGKIERSLGDSELYVVVIEKFFMRNGSYASLTIVVTGGDTSSRVEAIPSGAGEGLLNIGLGASGRFAADFERLMRESGYGQAN